MPEPEHDLPPGETPVCPGPEAETGTSLAGFSGENLSDSPSRFAGVAFRVQAGMIVFALCMGGLLGTDPWLLFRWNFESVLVGILGTIPLLIAMALLQYIPLKSFQWVEEFLVDRVAPLLDPVSPLTLFLLASLVGLGEELLFRGVLQESLCFFFTPLTAIVLTSIVFGLVHFISIAYIAIVFLMSLYLGYSGILFSPGEKLNLVPPVLIHTLYDYIAFLFIIHKYRQGRANNTSSPEEPGPA